MTTRLIITIKPAVKLRAKPPSKPSKPMIEGRNIQNTNTAIKISHRLTIRRCEFFMLNSRLDAGNAVETSFVNAFLIVSAENTG